MPSPSTPRTAPRHHLEVPPQIGLLWPSADTSQHHRDMRLTPAMALTLAETPFVVLNTASVHVCKRPALRELLQASQLLR